MDGLAEHMQRDRVEIWAYCLMPNTCIQRGSQNVHGLRAVRGDATYLSIDRQFFEFRTKSTAKINLLTTAESALDSGRMKRATEADRNELPCRNTR